MNWFACILFLNLSDSLREFSNVNSTFVAAVITKQKSASFSRTFYITPAIS